MNTAGGRGFSLNSSPFQAKPFPKLCFSSDNLTHFGYKNPVALRIAKCIICFFRITVFIMEMMYFSYCLLWYFAISLLSCLLGNSMGKYEGFFAFKAKEILKYL